MKKFTVLIIVVVLSACEQTNDRNSLKKDSGGAVQVFQKEPLQRAPSKAKNDMTYHPQCIINGVKHGNPSEKICNIARQKRMNIKPIIEWTNDRAKAVRELKTWLENTDMKTEEINRIFPYTRSTSDWEGKFDVSIEFSICKGPYQMYNEIQCSYFSNIAIIREKKTGRVFTDSYSE